jgi:16S rRNA (guanine966-N2)-methyltransferase
MRIIAGKYKGRRLKRPPLTHTRPTTERTRESLFNILSTILEREGVAFEQLNVLDVFAGSGALGFEALSRGAQFVTFIDISRQACDTITQNSQHLKVLQNITIMQGDARYPKKADKQYNLIFLDPPYGKALIKPVFDALREKNWFEDKAMLVMEFAADEASPTIESIDIILERVYGSTKILIGRLKQVSIP